jgi:glutathione S-transferase
VAAGRGGACAGALDRLRNAFGFQRPAQRHVDEHPGGLAGTRPHARRRACGRICEIWEDCLSRFGHRGFLLGDFSIADAFYAPVVMRFRTYGVALAPALQAYCERMLAHPAVARWVNEAMLETESTPLHDADLPRA